MAISIESVTKDLEKFQQKFGSDFIRVLCASVIIEHCDWNWNKIKSGILHDPDSKQLLINNENLNSKN
jgi:hypothetical protein